MKRCTACRSEGLLNRDDLCVVCEEDRARDYALYHKTDLNPDGTPKLPSAMAWDDDNRDYGVGDFPLSGPPITGSLDEKLEEEALWGDGPDGDEPEGEGEDEQC